MKKKKRDRNVLIKYTTRSSYSNQDRLTQTASPPVSYPTSKPHTDSVVQGIPLALSKEAKFEDIVHTCPIHVIEQSPSSQYGPSLESNQSAMEHVLTASGAVLLPLQLSTSVFKGLF